MGKRYYVATQTRGVFIYYFRMKNAARTNNTNEVIVA
jgi:hypothetical protein